MKVARVLFLVLLASLVPLLVPSGGTAAPPPTPTLVAIRAAHHPGFDRVVFEFRGGVPPRRDARWVNRLIADGSGLPVRIAGRAILEVVFDRADAHTNAGSPTAPGRVAFALPNVMNVVRSGDFEAVLSHGIGVARKTSFRISTLRQPSRVVVDVRADFPTVNRKVYFVDDDRFNASLDPVVSSVLRPVPRSTPGVGVLDRLFAGPTRAEQAQGLRLVRSKARSFADLSIRNQIARVRLTGGCSSGGSTVTIADELKPTLKQFDSVTWVKVFSPNGRTERPRGQSDSIPTCLEP